MTKPRIYLLCLVGGLLSGVFHTAWSMGFSSSSSRPNPWDGRGWSRPAAPPYAGKYVPLHQGPTRQGLTRQGGIGNPAGAGFSRTALPPMPQGMPQGGWQTPRAGLSGASHSPPRLEVEVSESSPYVQQTIVYTLRVISSGNVSQIDATAPKLGGVRLESLGEAQTRTSTQNGKPQFITEWHFALTPLQPGRLSIPAARVSGTMVANGRNVGAALPGQPPVGKAFKLSAAKPLVLGVQPANTAVQPWLPLNGLKVDRELSVKRTDQVGEPITLTLSYSAVGISGDQLPSLAPVSNSADFKLYREKSTTDTRLSSDGKNLLGARIDTFTLVPQSAGVLRLPALRIPWWNIATDSPESALVPGRGIRVAAGQAQGGQAGSADSGGTSIWTLDFWAPILLVLAGLLGYWLWVLLRAAGLVPRSQGKVRAFMVHSWQRTGARAWAQRAALSPVYRYRHLRQSLIFALPVSFKIWYCLKQIAAEENPADWCQMLQFLANKFLSLPLNAPVSDIARAMNQLNGRDNRAVLDPLVHKLEAAIYGSQSIDFRAWKKAFRRQFRPRLLPRIGRRSSAEPALPLLNPRAY